MVCPASRGLVSPLHSLPACVPVLDGVFTFPRSCPPPVFLLVSFCWMACPPSRGSYLPLSPIAFLLVPQTVCRSLGVLNAFLRCPPWFCVSAFARVFFPFVCHYTPSCFPLLDGVSAFPRSSPFVSHCLHICSCVGRWCVRLPDVLSSVVSPRLPSCLPLCLLPHVCLCWMVSLPWMVCPPSRDLVSPCFSLFPIASHCLAFSPRMCACAKRCVRFPEVLSPFVSHCLPLSPSLSPSLSSFLSPSLSPSLSLFLFSFVAGGFILHFPPCSVRLGVLNAFSCV